MGKCWILLFSLTVVYASKFRCGLCPAGFFVEGCKNSSIPKCGKCPDGSFKQGLNSLTQCIRCSSCHGRNNIEIKKCNGTHDSECRCKDGYWYDTGALFCSRCSTCRRGKGVVSNCSRTADTKCTRCTRGVSFSPVNSGTQPCRLCKICGDNEESVKKCTRRKDTECKPIPVKKKFQSANKSKWPDKDKDKTTLEPKTVEKETSSSVTSTAIELTTRPTTVSVGVGAIKSGDTEAPPVLTQTHLALIISSAILVVLIVIVLFGVLLIRHRRKTTQSKRTRTQVSAPLPSPYQPHKEPKTIENRLSNTPLMHAGSTDKLLRDVSYSLIDELSRNLNPKGRWKTLAGKLGFSSKDIENFELEPTNATATMLSHWAHHKNSTLHNLYDALKSLKWPLEADLVAKYL